MFSSEAFHSCSDQQKNVFSSSGQSLQTHPSAFYCSTLYLKVFLKPKLDIWLHNGLRLTGDGPQEPPGLNLKSSLCHVRMTERGGTEKSFFSVKADLSSGQQRTETQCFLKVVQRKERRVVLFNSTNLSQLQAGINERRHELERK